MAKHQYILKHFAIPNNQHDTGPQIILDNSVNSPYVIIQILDKVSEIAEYPINLKRPKEHFFSKI